MNLHIGAKEVAVLVTILLVALLTAYSSLGSPAPPSSSRESVAAPSNPSSPTLVTCGAENNVYPTGKTSTIVMVPCGPY